MNNNHRWGGEVVAPQPSTAARSGLIKRIDRFGLENIMKIIIHRKEQWDLVKNGVKNPWIVIAYQSPGHYHRLFCLWSGGISIGRFIWAWSKP